MKLQIITSKITDSVEVAFEKEYVQTPLVTISVTLDEQVSDADKALLPPQELQARLDAEQKLEQDVLNGDFRYIVVRRNSKGFTIKLNKPSPADVKFSWQALAVKDAKVSVSSASAILSVTTTPPASATPSSTPVITPTPQPSVTPSPSPTPAPSPPPPKMITINQTELGYLRVRDGPDTSYSEIGQVNVGDTLEVFEESEGWYQIEYEEGKYGWVSGNYVTVQ